MRLYLVRHGEAAAAAIDSARSLTPQGRMEAKTIADFLRRNGAKASAVWHSAKVRARETAEILQRDGALGGPLVEHRGLMPEDHASDVAFAINAESDDLCVVGHLPHLAYLASTLLVGPNAAPFVLFNTASALCMERNGPSRWHVLWFISPHHVQHLG